VDPTNSYIRLTIPDQAIYVTNVGNVTIRLRDASSSSQWTDAGGRRAALDGEIVTDYVDGKSISFRGGAHNLVALETTSLRPNPADWDVGSTNYVGTSTALAALGARARGTYTLLTFDAAFFAFRQVQLDITNATGEALVITNGAFATNSTLCGIAAAQADVDGLELPLGLGQPIPDVRQADMGPMVELNSGGGAITNLGGLNRKLTYVINIPTIALDLGGTTVSGSASGLVVAYAVLPAPETPPLLSVRRLGTNIVLAWPADQVGFSLSYATNLPATTWLPATPAPVILNDQHIVTNAITRNAVFYRLSKP
jgi:hypothetical protein